MKRLAITAAIVLLAAVAWGSYMGTFWEPYDPQPPLPGYPVRPLPDVSPATPNTQARFTAPQTRSIDSVDIATQQHALANAYLHNQPATPGPAVQPQDVNGNVPLGWHQHTDGSWYWVNPDTTLQPDQPPYPQFPNFPELGN